jgi:hypothetical protein
LRGMAQSKFDNLAKWKTLSIDEAEELAEMATLYVNKDNLRENKYEEWLWDYASTWMWMGKKPGAGEWEKLVVIGWKIVDLNSNKQK